MSTTRSPRPPRVHVELTRPPALDRRLDIRIDSEVLAELALIARAERMTAGRLAREILVGYVKQRKAAV